MTDQTKYDLVRARPSHTPNRQLASVRQVAAAAVFPQVVLMMLRQAGFMVLAGLLPACLLSSADASFYSFTPLSHLSLMAAYLAITITCFFPRLVLTQALLFVPPPGYRREPCLPRLCLARLHDTVTRDSTVQID